MYPISSSLGGPILLKPWMNIVTPTVIISLCFSERFVMNPIFSITCKCDVTFTFYVCFTCHVRHTSVCNLKVTKICICDDFVDSPLNTQWRTWKDSTSLASIFSDRGMLKVNASWPPPVRISPCSRAAWTPRTCERGNADEFEYCWPWPLLPARCELMGHLPALQLVSTMDEMQAKTVIGAQSNTALMSRFMSLDCEKTPGPKTWRLKFVQ